MTGDRFFPGHRPCFLSDLNTALGHPALKNHVGALPIIYQGSFPVSVGSLHVGSLGFYGTDPFRPEIFPDFRINGIQHPGFPLLQWRPCASFHTTGPFAGLKVTDKCLFENFLGHQGPAYLKHTPRRLTTKTKDIEST